MRRQADLAEAEQTLQFFRLNPNEDTRTIPLSDGLQYTWTRRDMTYLKEVINAHRIGTYDLDDMDEEEQEEEEVVYVDEIVTSTKSKADRVAAAKKLNELGQSIGQIAAILKLQPRTVKSYLK